MLKVGHHGERALESFCHWQHEEYGGARYLGNNHVPGGRDDLPPVDAAVFVTRCLSRDFGPPRLSLAGPPYIKASF